MKLWQWGVLISLFLILLFTSSALAVEKTQILRPEGEGYIRQLQPFGAANTWECVDDVAPDYNTTYTYNSNVGLWKTDSYIMGNFTLPTGYYKINSVTSRILFRMNGSGTGRIRHYLYNSTGSFSAGDYSPTTLNNVWYMDTYEWATNAVTGEAWTIEGINNAELGCSINDQENTYVTQVYFEVNYTHYFVNSTFSKNTFGGEIVVSYNGEPSIDESSASPANGTIGVSLPPTLSINVSDAEGDNTVVYFYDNSDDSLIGTDTCGAANRTATTTWNGLEYATLYSWYIIVEECPHKGTLNSNTSIVFNLTTRSVTQFSEKATFGGNLEIDTLGTTEWDIWNNGYDYFCWRGDNGTLSDVAALITDFDNPDEFVAVWNNNTWSTNNWCWTKYYADGNGTNANVYQLDVIYVYLLNGAGKQTISMTATTPPTCARTVPLNDFGDNVNRGYNYTCYCCDITEERDNGISDVAASIPLQTGEVLSWWDNSTQEWRGWIVGVSHADYDYSINVTSPIFETKIDKNTSWVILCP